MAREGVTEREQGKVCVYERERESVYILCMRRSCRHIFTAAFLLMLVWCSSIPFLIHIFICYQLLKFLALDLFQCTNIVSFHFVSSYLIVAAPFSRYSLFLCEPVNFCAGNLSKLPCNVHIHQITLVPPNTK